MLYQRMRGVEQRSAALAAANCLKLSWAGRGKIVLRQEHFRLAVLCSDANPVLH